MSYIPKSANQDRTIAALKFGMVCVVIVALGAYYFQSVTPRSLRVDVPPDLSAGTTVLVRDGVSPVPTANVYSFAHLMWQGINRWASDGAKDYGRQIFHYQHFLTPACQEQLKVDLDRRAKAGELASRTRAMSEIPGQAYSVGRVVAESDNAWLVLMDMQLTETVRGVAIKDAFIRYPLRIVRYDVNRDQNPWGLAVDCFGGNKPERLDPAVVAAGQARLAMATPAPVPVPLPVTLPDATNSTHPASTSTPSNVIEEKRP
jgi:integrating conjugative element protein (TIGR03746 family)